MDEADNEEVEGCNQMIQLKAQQNHDDTKLWKEGE